MRMCLASRAALALCLAFFSLSEVSARETVPFNGYSSGTVVIKTNERRLYYVLGDGRAVRYPVGVGRAGKQWFGNSSITGKYLKPAWSPPADVKRDNPRLPIHGTNVPGSVGGFVSYGCFRMYNEDVVDLFGRVRVGTPVLIEQ